VTQNVKRDLEAAVELEAELQARYGAAQRETEDAWAALQAAGQV
jgi:hypothetical protein